MIGSGWQNRLALAVVVFLLVIFGSSVTTKPVLASPLLVVPSNDDVSAATLISAMPYSASQDTTGATVASSDPTLPCRPYGNLVGTVWYQYTPATAGVLNVNTTGSSYDTVLTVWHGTPSNHVSAACDDDSGGILASSATAILNRGATYYIEVAGFASGGSGEGSLNLNATFTPIHNLLVNPSFESDSNHDNRPDGWTGLKRTSTVALDGSYAAVLKGTGDVNLMGWQAVKNLSGGQTYYAAGYVNVPDTSDSFTFLFRVRWRDATNRLVREDVLRGISGPTHGWFAVASPLVSPVGASSANVQLVATSLNGVIYVDSMMFGK